MGNAVTRKVFGIGNTLVVSLPPAVVERLGLREGAEVEVTVDEARGGILVVPDALPAPVITEEFAARVDSFIERYRPTLESLAR